MSMLERDQTVMEREIEQFLKVSQAEINLSLKDSAESIRELTKTFMDMVRDVHEIKVGLAGLKVAQTEQAAKANLEKICDTYLDKVQDSTVGFQFYDKLTQRLQHNVRSMNKMMQMLERQGGYDAAAWEQFRSDMKSRYNTEKDRLMFEALMEGKSIQTAISIAADARTGEGSVELF
ncbi:MAG: hypothetical protein OEW58_01780 [Gammaproteobacteria bacterium]|nr:hypothetical protein [Gammaproteobacteria bacterium]